LISQVPALESEKGNLFESNAIAYYLSNDQLRGADELQKAQVIQWLGFADSLILPGLYSWVYSALKIIALDQGTIEEGKQSLLKALTTLNDVLLSRTWLVGERLTLADIVVGTSLLQAYQTVLEPSIRNKYPNVTRWFQTFVNQPQVKSVIGEVKLNEKTGVTTATKAAAAPADSKKNKDKKADAKKQEDKKKKPEAAKPKPQDDGDDLGEDEPVEKPAKDPFDALPKGTWVMDDFKRFYSNNPEDKAIDYFWQKFDKENFSIWYGEYKYPEELTMVFMSCNLMSGMMQRLERMRKNAFGSLCLFGEDGNSQISQLWVWRGHDLAFELSPDWTVDYSSYDWKKVNPDTDEAKKLVHDYFMQSEDWVQHGKKFNQGKIFK
jgi:elongation factor 1-gamma